MATKTNAMMDDLIRSRRAEMAAVPGDEPEAEDNPAEEQKEYVVAAPGEPATEGRFEYEPFIDVPGSWVVYPPGVPCDDNEYRVEMDGPAGADDFEGMQAALDNRETASPRPPITEKKVEPGQDFPQLNA